MALRANLSAPRIEQDAWPWHHAKWAELSASLIFAADRRMEAENYLAGGYGIRLAMEARKAGWAHVNQLAKVWQPSRLKGIQVSPEFGTPFLAATQVFDLRPVPRKFLSLDRTDNAEQRFVQKGMILVTCSGNVGRTTIAHDPHEGILISHDLLRVDARQQKHWGWLYAYLRSQQARAMMSASQYGHVIKHLEVSHLDSLPVPLLREDLLAEFSEQVLSLFNMRDTAYTLTQNAEKLFSDSIKNFECPEDQDTGFSVKSSEIFGSRRRLEASFHTPVATTILKHFVSRNLQIVPLSSVTERVWWMTRFKRVFGDGGTPYMSADDLFTLNPPIAKRVLLEQANNADDYFIKAGWIMMACSGQVYGLNGSVALMTDKHEQTFFSHDLVRIVPRRGTIRPGYLFMTLSHPQLGRPLVIRYAYGTSIPHLEPEDIGTFPVVRLDYDIETKIADLIEEATDLRAQADQLENDIASEAEAILDRFIDGDTREVVVGL